jgi:hypothetical protein
MAGLIATDCVPKVALAGVLGAIDAGAGPAMATAGKVARIAMATKALREMPKQILRLKM